MQPEHRASETKRSGNIDFLAHKTPETQSFGNKTLREHDVLEHKIAEIWSFENMTFWNINPGNMELFGRERRGGGLKGGCSGNIELREPKVLGT